MTRKRKLQHAQGGRPKKLAQQPKKNDANGPGSHHAPVKKHRQHHRPEPPTIPFEPHERILLIGEGDLSFATSLIEHHGCVNVTATVLERDEKELVEKYPHAEAHAAVIRDEVVKTKQENQEDKDTDAKQEDKDSLEEEYTVEELDSDPEQDDEWEGFEIEEREDEDSSSRPSSNQLPRSSNNNNNNKLLFNIDATKPPPSLLRTRHDHIIFNFPHVGGKSTDVNRQVRHNQSLLVGFFERILPALAPGGSIVVTLFEGEPYTLWNIRDLGRHAGLAVETSFRFQSAAYPGYRHARTLGVVRRKDGEVGGGWRGEERAARSYVFRRKGEVREVQKRKKKDDSSDDDDDD